MLKRTTQTAIAALLIAGGATAAAAQGDTSPNRDTGNQGSNAQTSQANQNQNLAPHVRRYIDILEKNQPAETAHAIDVREGQQKRSQQARQQGQQGWGQTKVEDLPPGMVVYMVPQGALDAGVHDPQSRMTIGQELPTQTMRGTIAVVPVPAGQQQGAQARQQQAATPYEQGYAEFMSEPRATPGLQRRQEQMGRQQTAATPYERGYENLREERLRAMDRSYQAWREEIAQQMDEMYRREGQQQAAAPDAIYVDPRSGAVIDPDVAYVTPQGFVIIDQRPDMPGIQPVDR